MIGSRHSRVIARLLTRNTVKKYTLYAWHPKRLDPRGQALDKAAIIEHLNNLSIYPPARNQPLISLAAVIEEWAEQQRQGDIFDRVTIKAYANLVDYYEHHDVSHMALHTLPSVNFDSFYYRFITQALKLGLIVHSDIDNGTYYPDFSSEPAFLMSRLDKLKLRLPAKQVVEDFVGAQVNLHNPRIPHVDNIQQFSQASTTTSKTYAATADSSLSGSSVVINPITTVNNPITPTNSEAVKTNSTPEAMAPLLTDVPIASEDSELLAQLKLTIENYFDPRNIVYQLKKHTGALAWDVLFDWHDSQIVLTYILEPSYITSECKLDIIYKIIPPNRYLTPSFKQLFTGENSLNILHKSKLFIEGSLKDIEQYQRLFKAKTPILKRQPLASFADLKHQVDTDSEFILGLLADHQGFYPLFDTLYHDTDHPLHEFYWGAAETRPLPRSRFSRRRSIFLTLARLIEHPDLEEMIANQRPIMLNYFDQHSQLMPIMHNLKDQFMGMCDQLLLGYQQK